MVLFEPNDVFVAIGLRYRCDFDIKSEGDGGFYVVMSIISGSCLTPSIMSSFFLLLRQVDELTTHLVSGGYRSS